MSAIPLIPATAPTIPLTPLGKDDLAGWLAAAPAMAARWAEATGYKGEAGQTCLVPDGEGGIARVLVGVETADQPWDWAAAAQKLPTGAYRIDAPLSAQAAEAAALGWGLAAYGFERYRAQPRPRPELVWPDGADRRRVLRLLAATRLARDLINTPAADMGPEELASAAIAVGERHRAQVTVIVGEELLTHNYPLVHAVGRASSRAPRLIDLVWGDADRPHVTLVGKGVCFDSGGLNLKSAAAMKLMKKDMGGAAVLLALADALLDRALPVRLRLLIPAVENSVSGSAMRPLDVLRSRSGRTVEIGNTDAEGRLILADALTAAMSDPPALLIDAATLTGAARAALGSEVPALFCNDDAVAAALLESAQVTGDPLWRMPLWAPYRRHLDSKVADVNSAPDHPFAGAILAALFLKEFVQPDVPWAHIDMMAWNVEARPGRPKGGEAMALRALYHFLERRFSPTA